MNNSPTAVVLPCSTEDFGKFISGLLGKPQTMSNTVQGPFEITQRDIIDVHALLTQRVAQQNQGVLMQFTAKLVFSDDSSVLLNSIEDLSTYTEVRAVACLALHLSWVFLVKFNDKTHPEKQQIDLSFIGGYGSSMIDRDIPIMLFNEPDVGYIAYRISHTARTWGSDMDLLLSSHLRGVVDEIPKIRKWLSKHDDKISLITFAVIFLASIIGTFYATASFVAKQKAAVLGLGAITPTAAVTSQQMAYLLDTIASGTWERYLLISVVFLLFSLVVSILMAIWVGSTADNLPPSFLLLTKESEKRKKRILSKRNAKWWSFISSLIVGLGLGIGGNICYALWFEQLIRS